MLEFGIKFCKAFIFSLILLLLLCTHQNHQSELRKIGRFLIKLKDQNRTFSDKLWNSAALLLFDEEERGGGTGFDASTLFYQKPKKKLPLTNRKKAIQNAIFEFPKEIPNSVF